MDLKKRVTGILKDPKTEWPVIASEADDIGTIYTSYIMLVAAVPAAALLLGLVLFGPFVALRAAMTAYVSALVSPIVAAVVIEQLASRFKSSGTTVQALKLVAYASTPVWMAGVVYVIPFLAPLVLIAVIYAIYLFYLGLTPMMKTPPEQVLPFMVVSAITIVAVSLVLRVLARGLGMPMYGF